MHSLKEKPWAQALFAGLCLLAFLTLVFCIALFKSSMEARAFNRATGKNVSAWDAMWIDLRVQESPR